MKKLLFFVLLSALSFSFVSCDDDDDNNNAWIEANQNAYNDIKNDINYWPVTTPGGPTGVYRKVIKSGNGTEYPLQTSKVKVYYQGTYYDGTVFDSGKLEGNPAEFSLSSVVRGFSIALQNMVVGDKWEVWIPWNLGYGAQGLLNSSTGATIIPGYTTLVFQVELLEIEQYP